MIDQRHLNTLGRIMPGEALELIQDTFADPGAHHSPGEMAKLGAALSDLGARLTAASKDIMLQRIEGGVGQSAREVDDGVMFAWRKPHEQTALKTAKAKEYLPIHEYPECYQKRFVRGGVTVTITDSGGR